VVAAAACGWVRSIRRDAVAATDADDAASILEVRSRNDSAERDAVDAKMITE
jgi:hypothetical protein